MKAHGAPTNNVHPPVALFCDRGMDVVCDVVLVTHYMVSLPLLFFFSSRA